MNGELIKKSNKRALLVFVGCCVLQAAGIGTVLASSAVFFATVPKALGLSMGTFALWITMYTIGAFIMLPVVGNLFGKIGPQKVMSTGVIVCALCFVLFSMSSQAWHFIVIGLFVGLSGASLFLYPTPVLIGNWFAKKKGLCTGIAMTFIGIGGAIFPHFFTMLMPSIGWRGVYLVNAAVLIVLILPFTLFVFKLKPADIGLLPYGSSEEDNKRDNVQKTADASGVSAKNAVRSMAFICVLLTCGFLAFFGSYKSFMIAYAVNLGHSPEFGATLMTAIHAGVIVATPATGALIDRFGVKPTVVLQCFIIILSYLSYVFLHGQAALVVATFFFGTNSSLCTVVCPMFVREIFGNKDYEKLFSYASMSVGLVSGISVPLVGYLYDMTGTYTTGFYFGIGACVIIMLSSYLSAAFSKSLVREKVSSLCGKTLTA